MSPNLVSQLAPRFSGVLPLDVGDIVPQRDEAASRAIKKPQLVTGAVACEFYGAKPELYFRKAFAWIRAVGSKTGGAQIVMGVGHHPNKLSSSSLGSK